MQINDNDDDDDARHPMIGP